MAEKKLSELLLDIFVTTKRHASIEIFARFERLTADEPLLYVDPPAWAAAAHAIVVDDTVHYLWAEKRAENYWVHMHSWAPTNAPTQVVHRDVHPG